jgi:hypothetical protein
MTIALPRQNSAGFLVDEARTSITTLHPSGIARQNQGQTLAAAKNGVPRRAIVSDAPKPKAPA